MTYRTKKILGVTCTVVRDTVSEHGRPLELTFDWYAQDEQGNVWYMGEDSRELKNGHFVRASDSWQSGVDGAEPGIIMEGRPHAGDVYRQAYYPPGGALDQARVLDETRSSRCRPERTSGRSRRSSGARWSLSWRRRSTQQVSARSRSRSFAEDTSASSSSRCNTDSRASRSLQEDARSATSPMTLARSSGRDHIGQ